MLFVSSRNKTDSFTPYRTLCNDMAPDGGCFVPYQLPALDDKALNEMREKSFCDNVAEVLNLFFATKLTAWDVECAAGRKPVRLVPMPYRLMILECFHNVAGSYSYLEKALFEKLNGQASAPTVWARIAIRVAVLLATYATMNTPERRSFDVAVNTGDFCTPMAVWYCRKLGMPIQSIICCCNDNGAVWDLIQRGEFNTGAPVINTGMPDLDYPRPDQLEQLIYHTLGFEQVSIYKACCDKKGIFHLDAEQFSLLSDGLHAAVVSKSRIGSIVQSVKRTNQYSISERTATSFGGLQDHRSRTGESRYILVFADDKTA